MGTDKNWLSVDVEIESPLFSAEARDYGPKEQIYTQTQSTAGDCTNTCCSETCHPCG